MNLDDTKIPIIDLFAGPGGLGEGFATFSPGGSNNAPFQVCASVEMDPFAHQTLELRSFFHEFSGNSVPDEYYQYLRNEISKEELYEKYPKEASSASDKAIKATLGVPEDDERVYKALSEMLSKKHGNPWVLVGGPPCQAYSTIGRSRLQAHGAGQEVHQKDPRNFLYRQYLRTIAKFKPEVFVMENVKGILSAQVDGKKIFHDILKDLRSPEDALKEYDLLFGAKLSHSKLNYKIYSLVVSKENGTDLEPRDYIIQSEDYGVPQARHRVILLGVRSDIDIKPTTLKKAMSKVSVKSVISDLPSLRSSFTKTVDNPKEWYDFVVAIKGQDWFSNYQPVVSSDNDISPEIMKREMETYISKIQNDLTTGAEFIPTKVKTTYRSDWYNDERIDGVVNHTARSHMKEDLYRYFFAASFTNVMGRSPRMKDYPRELLPKHKNVEAAISTGAFGDRFRVQESSKPSTTVTCHIAKDGHYNIHYDPKQIRSLTVREAARLQSFPDNYYFVGPRSQQYRQVGNAVPPILASQIAEVVYDLLSKLKAKSNEIRRDNSDNMVYSADLSPKKIPVVSIN